MAIDAGTVVVTVVPNTSGFTSKLTALMTGVGKTLAKAGISEGAAATGVAVAVLGTAATKAALDFEAAFTRIDAISNASQASIEQWKGQVLELAGSTAQSPQELADALYFLASAGLETSQVMDTLSVSAQASAVGLGDTAVIARLNAQALNAYADSGLTATEATDTLVAAVKAGTAEPEEFAESLGRVLPIASKAGVSYEEVAASLASLSNIGLDVSIGTTALRGLLSALVAPGTEAAQTLAELGISAQELRDTLSEGGLLKALQLLEQRSGGNIDVLKKIVPNIRALTAELGLTGENAEHVQEIFLEVATSTGDLSEAFATTAEGPMFQFQQVAANAQVVLIELGEAILPVATAVAEVLGDAFGALGSIIAEHTGLVTALIAAYVGFQAVKFVPLLLDLIFGALVRISAAGLTAMATGLYQIAQALLTMGATNAAFALGAVAETLPLLAASVPIVASGIALGVGAFIGANKVMESMHTNAQSLVEQFKGISTEFGQIADDASSGFGARDWLGFIGDPFATSATRAEEFAATGQHLVEVGQEMGLTYDEANQILVQHGDILNENRASQEEFTDAVTATFDIVSTAKQASYLKGILNFSQGITRMGIGGKYTSTVFDEFGTVLLNNTKLELAQKTAIAGQIEQIYNLGGGLNYAESQWLKQNLAAGNFKVITAGLRDDIDNLVEGLTGGGDEVSKQFLKVLDNGTALAEGIGTDFESLRSEAFDAFNLDAQHFGENFEGVVQEVLGKVDDLRAGFTDSFGSFADDALGGLLEQANFTVDGVIGAFNKAKNATKDFSQDLLTISRTGAAGKSLASELLANAGPDAAAFASFIAGASKKARESMVNAFGGAKDAAATAGQAMTRAIVGPLKDIRGLLQQLVRTQWHIPVDADTAAAKAAIQGIYDLYGGKTLFITVAAAGGLGGHGGGVSPSDYGPSELGSYIPGAARGGFVDRPGILHVGERHRREMVLPLENKQGVNALARAMGMAARSLDGGKVRGGDGGTAKLVISGPVKLQVGKTSMDAYISGVARAEDDKQSRYDERLSRMRRD